MEKNTTRIIRSVNTSKNNFTPISNTLLKNENLSLEARGLLAFIISLPETWIIWKGVIQKKLKLGRYHFDRVWKECSDAGYIKTKKYRTSKGNFAYHYEITDNLSVVDSTDAQLSDSGLFIVGKPNTIEKKDEEKKDVENIDLLNKEAAKPRLVYERLIKGVLQTSDKELFFNSLEDINELGANKLAEENNWSESQRLRFIEETELNYNKITNPYGY